MCGSEVTRLPEKSRGVPALLEDRASFFQPDDEEVPSPCVSVCSMNANRTLCQGCFRTIPEIVAWSKSDAAGRRAIWGRVLDRAGIEGL
jgi:predicted Fe-S protein YdhL (DUF1289 family)